jgi:hypothetical protein
VTTKVPNVTGERANTSVRPPEQQRPGSRGCAAPTGRAAPREGDDRHEGDGMPSWLRAPKMPLDGAEPLRLPLDAEESERGTDENTGEDL